MEDGLPLFVDKERVDGAPLMITEEVLDLFKCGIYTNNSYSPVMVNNISYIN